MGDNKMASEDVQKELAILGEIAKHHSKSIDKLVEFQDKQLILQEKQIYQDEKIDDIVETQSLFLIDQKKMQEEITKNHISIKVYGGVIASLVTILTLFCQFASILPK